MSAAREWIGNCSRRATEFHSVDSQPQGYAVSLSPWRVPRLLLVFCLLTFAQLWVFNTGYLDAVFPQRDYILVPYGGHHVIAVRTFIVSFYVAYAIFAPGAVAARAVMAIDLILRFLTICFVLDIANVAFLSLFGLSYPLSAAQIIAGLSGFGLFALTLLQRATLPRPTTLERDGRMRVRDVGRLGASAFIAGSMSSLVGFSHVPIVEDLRQIALLGGIGPGVVLFLPLFFMQLFLIGVVEQALTARKGFRVPVSVIVPAHNEAPVIAETIHSVAAAARHYGAPVELIVLNNNSRDNTREVAMAAIERASGLEGRVIDVETPGKAHALNRGIALASHPLTIRIDADTQIGEDNITLAVENFADEEIGVVGGIPVPPGGAMFDRARAIEVLLKHGFYSPALASFGGLVGVPGMFAVYRTELLRRAGGFATGMNGEDTDMSLRISELGYRATVDRRVRYVSEVPATFAHLREQRLRWFRSVYHVSSRCRLAMFSSFSVRGRLVLPYMLLNAARRAMMLPILLFGFIQLLTDQNPDSPLAWQAIAALLLGAPALMAVSAVLLAGRPAALLGLPEYFVFRAMRAWFTLESVLTIPVGQAGARRPS